MGRDSSSLRECKRNNAHPSLNWGVIPQPQRVRTINSTLPRSQQHQGNESDCASVPLPQRAIFFENQRDGRLFWLSHLLLSFPSRTSQAVPTSSFTSVLLSL